jgi:isoleucyl-tRNA synthetase
MLNSPVVRGEGLRFTEEGVKHSLRHLLIPLWNSYSFFVTYANIDGWTTEKMEGLPPGDNQLDRWIRSSMESLIAGVTDAMESYDLQRAVRPFVRFIDDLTNWYIRRSRRRFWKSQDDDDKNQAYQTLNYVLLQLSKIAAPCVPFISETIYRNLRTSSMPESVHLCDFPIADSSNRDTALEDEMETVMTIVRMGRLLRTEHSLKVRQPLAKLHVVCNKASVLEKLSDFSAIMKEELNVKELSFGNNESDLASLKAKADFRKLGPRFGSKMKQVAAVIAKLEHDTLVKLSGGGTISIEVNGENFELQSEDVVIERIPLEGLVVASEGHLIVALETELSDELVEEGLVREFVSRVQNIRKQADLEVTRRIRIEFSGDEDLRRAVSSYEDYLKTEVLAVGCTCVDTVSDGEELDLNGHICNIKIIPEG